MKKKVNRKSSLLETPTEMADFPSSSLNESPKSPLFTIISDKKKKSTVSTSKNKNADKSQPTIAAVKTLGTISDLKDLASSRLDHLKRHIEHSHSEIIKDLQASHSRLHKRFKIQTQACQQAMDEAEKEYKKMSERISESREAMQASYAEFKADAQASASRACKTSIAELSESCEKAINNLQSRFGISSA
ncbi:uncharacterized protein LOC126713047 [Quercus robur]|uniref:uncharacterized protein LOC126713047 n=1 Tax=Quercus robur TaxID=38942 RepID=UPI0021628706|nr:uncharacterized protein LOC126713047 [Quercus robur]XP_050268648.1 uncharacterized protein LOC126713047 [Quercus robur]